MHPRHRLQKMGGRLNHFFRYNRVGIRSCVSSYILLDTDDRYHYHFSTSCSLPRCSCHSVFFKIRGQSHMGHCQSQDWDPNFTSSEWMTELSPLFRAKLHLSDLTLGWVGGCMAALCLCVRMKGTVPQFDFYRLNPHQAGTGLLHSEFLHITSSSGSF